MAHNPGDQICGRFELVRAESSGTGSPLFGDAWAALDRESGEVVRLVLLGPDLLPTAEAREALVKRLSRLCEGEQNDALVPLSFAGCEGEFVVAAFEGLYVGICLSDVIADLEVRDRMAEVGKLIVDVAVGLAVLHGRGFFHGALGIETIFVWERGNALWQHGLAQGCAGPELAVRIAESGQIVAPEFAESGRASAASDVFAWAVVIATYVSALPPAEALEALRAGTVLEGSGKLLEVLQRAADPAPERRFADGRSLVKALRGAALLIVSGEEEDVDDESLIALAEAGVDPVIVEELPAEVLAIPAVETPKAAAKSDAVKPPAAAKPAEQVAATEPAIAKAAMATAKPARAAAAEQAAKPAVAKPARAATAEQAAKPTAKAAKPTAKPGARPINPATAEQAGAKPATAGARPIKPATAEQAAKVAAKAAAGEVAADPAGAKPGAKPVRAAAKPAAAKPAARLESEAKPKAQAKPAASRARPRQPAPAKVVKPPSLTLKAGAQAASRMPVLPSRRPGATTGLSAASKPGAKASMPALAQRSPQTAPLSPSAPVAASPSPSATELTSGSPATASEDSSPGLGDAVAAALGDLSGSSGELPRPYLPSLGEPSGARPAAAVVVKGGKISEPEEGRGKKVHVLEASGRSSASDSSLKTSALVNMALAGGREPEGETSSLEESSRLADAVAAATATTATAPQEPELAPSEADPPVVSEEQASGQSATGQVSGESTASGVGASHDSAEARAIVAATTVGEQPGVEEKKEQDDSRSLLILLALAAAVLVGYVLWGSSQ